MKKNDIVVYFPTLDDLEDAKKNYPTDITLAVDVGAIDTYIVGAGPSF